MPKNFLFILPIIAVLWVYGEVWQFEYVWDDVALFLNNVPLRQALSMDEVWGAVSRPILPGTTYFRPAVLFTFWVEFRFTGGSPVISHLVNLFLHVLNVILVGVLALQLWRTTVDRLPWVPVVAMTFYGLNPALHEAVCWASGRFDLLATTFVLLSCIFFSKQGAGFWRVIAASLSFLLALLSKEVAVVTPGLIAGVMVMVRLQNDVITGRMTWAHWWRPFLLAARKPILLILAVFSVYLVLRVGTMPSLMHENQALSNLTFLARLALIGKTVAFYAVATTFPFMEMSPQHPYDPSALGWVDGIPLVLFLGLASLSISRAMRGSGLAIVLLMAIFCLLPVLNIIPLTIGFNVGHERFLTLPMAFFAILVARLVAYALNYFSAPLVGVLCGCFVVLYVANLRVTVPLWRNELSLWSWAHSQHPQSSFVQHSLVTAALKWNNLDLARRVIERSKAIGVSEAMLFLEADLLVKEKKYDEGLALARTVMASKLRLHEQYPDHESVPRDEWDRSVLDNWHLPAALVTIGNACISTKRFKEAEMAAKQAIFYSPKFPPAMLIYAYAIWGQGLRSEGDEAYRAALGAYATPVREDVQKLTKSYLAQLCNVPGHSFACAAERVR